MSVWRDAAPRLDFVDTERMNVFATRKGNQPERIGEP